MSRPSFHSICFATWALQSCELQGPFSLPSALVDLPDTIHTLCLIPHSAPNQTSLADFMGSASLQSLSLNVSWSLGEDPHDQYNSYEEPDELSKFLHVSKYNLFDSMYSHDTFDLLLDGRCPTLQSLTLQGLFCCKAAPGIDLASCLPVLQHLRTTVRGDEQGICLAQDMMGLPPLHTLVLEVLHGD